MLRSIFYICTYDTNEYDNSHRYCFQICLKIHLKLLMKCIPARACAADRQVVTSRVASTLLHSLSFLTDNTSHREPLVITFWLKLPGNYFQQNDAIRVVWSTSQLTGNFLQTGALQVSAFPPQTNKQNKNSKCLSGVGRVSVNSTYERSTKNKLLLLRVIWLIKKYFKG